MIETVQIEVSEGLKVVTRQGEGPDKSLCLIMVRNDGRGNGLGDHIQSLPIIYKLIDLGYQVTIYAAEFFRPVYERAGCEFFSQKDLYFGIIEDLLPKYQTVSTLIEWSIDDDVASKGNSMKDRVSFFGSFFGVQRPQEFDFAFALGANKDEQLRGLEMLIYAPQSSSMWRTLARREQIAHLLKKKYQNVMWIESPGGGLREQISDFETLVDTIYNAKIVFAVDNGIMHLASALGVPAFAVFGMTNEKIICEPYDYYLPGKKSIRSYFHSAPSDKDGCSYPCSAHSAKGFKANGKCRDFADCMTDISTPNLLENFHNFYSTIRSN